MAPKRSKRQLQPQAPTVANKVLPTCEGPKLNRFKHNNAAIQFVKLLGAKTPGDDGHVFEVVIESKRYALKIFRFFDPPTEDDDLAVLKISDEKYIFHFDPFYAECRAYGCIEDNNQNGEVAVRCYGFMAISAEREEELAALPFHIDPSEWNRPEQEYDRPTRERQPFRAIVKELVKSKTHLSRITQMRRDLLALHRMGVYVQDIRKDNYINGKLVDFSRSWTNPHILLDPHVRSRELIKLEMEGDLYSFDLMLEEAGIRTRVKALPESNKEIGRLRSKTKEPDRFGF